MLHVPAYQQPHPEILGYKIVHKHRLFLNHNYWRTTLSHGVPHFIKSGPTPSTTILNHLQAPKAILNHLNPPKNNHLQLTHKPPTIAKISSQHEIEIVGLFNRPAVDERFRLSSCSINNLSLCVEKEKGTIYKGHHCSYSFFMENLITVALIFS